MRGVRSARGNTRVVVIGVCNIVGVVVGVVVGAAHVAHIVERRLNLCIARSKGHIQLFETEMQWNEFRKVSRLGYIVMNSCSGAYRN